MPEPNLTHVSTSGPRPSADSWAGPDVRLARHPERGSHERAQVAAIIDEALLAHVAFEADGQAMCMPTAHARLGEHIYLHGAVKNRTLRALCERGRASLTFTLLDGLVLARTAFHHSMNFRSVVVLGPACEVTDPAEKQSALRALIDHLAEGRMQELTQPTPNELAATLVVRVTIEQASSKSRSGPPLDSDADLERDVWAGTVPMQLRAGAPLADARLRSTQAMSPAAAKRALGSAHTGELHSIERGEYLFSTDPALLQLSWIHAFLRDQSYWAPGLDEGRFRAALQHSINFGVYRAGEQVAFARVLTDAARFAYLCDVFVAEPHRGRGLGKQLIAFVLEHPGVRDATRCVLGTRDAHGLYERFGWRRTDAERYMLRMQHDPSAPYHLR